MLSVVVFLRCRRPPRSTRTATLLPYPRVSRSVGFGFDFAVRKSPPQTAEENRGATGEYFWDGMASTLFWVDPANRLTAVFFVQTIPYDGTLHRDFRAAVYGPNYKGPAGD